MAIEEVHKVDTIFEDRDGGAIRLLMVEAREWSLSQERTAELEDKISAYYNFVASGQLAKVLPDAKERKVVVELVCQHQPPAELASMFPQVRSLFVRQKIDFRVVFARELCGSLAESQIYP